MDHNESYRKYMINNNYFTCESFTHVFVFDDKRSVRLTAYLWDSYESALEYIRRISPSCEYRYSHTEHISGHGKEVFHCHQFAKTDPNNLTRSSLSELNF